MHYLYLALAIVTEVVATTSLKASQSLTRPGPTLLMLVGYLLSFLFLSLCMRTMAVGVIYALWSGLGIVFITAAAAVLFGQKPDAPAIIGMALIIGGVATIHIFSRMTVH